MANIEIHAVGTEAVSMLSISSLLLDVFPGSPLTEKFLRWQYQDNPLGHALGFSALDGNEVVSHYGAIPISAELHGEHELGLLSLNTATHPNYAGKGLFTRLAEETYGRAVDAGFGFVIGVSNSASTNGFVRRLAFQNVGTLKAQVGVGRLTKRESSVCQFSRTWSKDLIAWRLSNPVQTYTQRKYTDGSSEVRSATGYPFVGAVLSSFGSEILPGLVASDYSQLSLQLGLDPEWSPSQWRYMDIPMWLRPSPLNLIFRDLTNRKRTLEAENVRFHAIDFDPY